MDKQEFFLLIPAIIYGVAIVDLLKIFNHKKNYIEMMGWGIYVMFAVIHNWTELYAKLELITDSQLNFFLFIVQAILLAKMANIITPEAKDDDTKAYFFSVRKPFFFLASITLIYNILLQHFIFEDKVPFFLRAVGVTTFLIVGFSNKFWLRITILALVFGISLLLLFTPYIRV